MLEPAVCYTFSLLSNISTSHESLHCKSRLEQRAMSTSTSTRKRKATIGLSTSDKKAKTVSACTPSIPASSTFHDVTRHLLICKRKCCYHTDLWIQSSKKWQMPAKSRPTTGRGGASIQLPELQAGDQGIWITCDMHKEAACAAECVRLFEEVRFGFPGLSILSFVFINL